MRTLYSMTVIIVSIMMFVSLYVPISAYSAMDDRSDRLSNEQSSVFLPGYINATKQHTDEIIRQVNRPGRTIDRNMDNVDNKLTANVSEDANKKVVPELKKKTGGKESAPNKRSVNTTTAINIMPIAENSDRMLNEANDQGPVSTRLIKYDKDENEIPGEVVTTWIENDNAYFSIKDNKGNFIVEKQAFNTDGNGKSYISDIMVRNEGQFDVVLTIYDYSVTGDIYTYNATKSYRSYDNNGEIEGCGSYQWDLKSYYRQDLKTGEVTSNFNNVDSMPFADINMDGRVDSSDYSLIDTSYNMHLFEGLKSGKFSSVSPGVLAIWKRADINRDGVINNTDFAILNLAYVGRSTGKDFLSDVKADRSTIQTVFADYVPLNNRAAPDFTKIEYENKTGLVNPISGLNTNKSLSLESPTRGLATNTAPNFDIVKEKQGMEGLLTQALVNNKDALAIQTLFMNNEGRAIDTTALLSNILKNPAEDQKEVLDVASSLLKAVNNIEQGSDSPEAIKKASDDLLQMVAAVLIAQAIPDILKEGDVGNIKNIFQELNITKGKVMLDYQESVKPYYDEIRKLLNKNIAILQLNNVLSKQMMAEELKKLEPGEIDKILEKVRKIEKKSFEEDYILQQEAKYRKQYIDPNKKVLEDKMKTMMKDFTQRISKVLEGAGAGKK